MATELTERIARGAQRISDYRGATTAAVYSGTPAEFEALRTSCGVYDLSWRAKIRMTGEDRVRWLNGMVTNNVRDLAENHGVYAFVLTPHGRIVGDLYAYNRGDSLLVDTDRQQLTKLMETFDHYIIMDDVEVESIDDKLVGIGVAGPNSKAVLTRVGIEVPDLAALELANIPFKGKVVTLVRSDFPRVETYELWLAPDDLGHAWEALVDGGAVPTGSDAVELLRIAGGVPRYGIDIRDRDLPQETMQDRALNFQKGCYIGQEIVERIRSRGSVHRAFTGFLIDGSLPSPGAKILAEGKEIGELTSVAALPLGSGECKVALGYVRREFARPEVKVQVDGSSASVATVPFRCAIS